jgi:aspartate aminotransferase-like enzyme
LLQYVFQTKSQVITITGSGTAAAEAAIVGCCPPGHKALVVVNGKFAERWAQVCQTFNIDHAELPIEWGHGASAADITQAMDADAKIDTVICVHSETSAAAVSDIEGIGKITRDRGAILIVDGITSVGVIPVRMDDWGVDAYITGSQKAMMLPPGLGFVAVSERAWERIDSGKTPTLYNDLKAYRKSLENWDVPYTPAVTLVRGLLKALQGFKDRGLENIWSEASTMARATRAAAEAMGLKVFAKDPVDSVTAMVVPEGVDEAALRKTMRGTHGFQIAGGQGHLKGKIIRFSHMGYLDSFDILGAIAALELTLIGQGYKLEPGTGLAAAQTVFAQAATK